MKTRRPFIPQRKLVFLGCEGESEKSYAGFLQDLIHEAGLHVHLNIEVLKAGDPLSRIELALSKLAKLRRTRGNFAERFVFLDTDQLALSPDRARRVRTLAAANYIRVIWQEPCFEALLLRHFQGRATHRPPTSQVAQNALLHEWPEYQKPMSRAELAVKIDRQAVTRAAGVEHDLMSLLQCIGLMPFDDAQG